MRSVMHPAISNMWPRHISYAPLRRFLCKKSWSNKGFYSNPLLYCRNIEINKISQLGIIEFSTCEQFQANNQLANFYHSGTLLRGQEPSSKVEEAIKTIKEEKEKQKVNSYTITAITQVPGKAIESKKNLWQKIKAELLHYYHGFRLLYLDMKVSGKLICRILQGYELNRREHRLLIKTTGDMFRLIPFSVFIIVPFMEFLLPLAIKFFPGLLPSTFQTANEKEDKLKQALKVKIEMAKFLQKTLDEMAVQSSNNHSERAKEFVDFFYKLRTTGSVASNEDIMKFSKLFEDEITLDSLSRQQLIALCRVLDVQTLGTTNFLRFLLRMKLRSLAADDKLIEKEGVDTLTRTELQQACRARGMRAYGMPEQRLREQLLQWLDLSLSKKVPPSLLLLSRALMVPDTIPMSDKLKATISALPDSVIARTKGAIGEKEGKLDHVTNIEIIKMEEKKIEEEREEERKINLSTVKKGSDNEAKSFAASEITTTDVKVLEQALDSIGKEKRMMSIEKEELKELKEEMADYREDLQELHELKTEAKGLAHIDDIKVSKGANRLYTKVNKLISKLDTILSDLEQSEKRMKKEMDTLSNQQKSESLVAAELIRIDELILAIKQVQNVPDNHRLARITEILGEIDDDGDGAIRIEDVLKVVGLISKEDIKLSKTQLNEFIKLLEKEEVLEVEEQIHKALEKESSSAAHFQSNKIVGSTADVLNGNKKKVLSQVTSNDIKLTNNVNTKPGKPVLTENKNSTDLSHSRRSDLVPESTLPSNVSSPTKKLKGSKQL